MANMRVPFLDVLAQYPHATKDIWEHITNVCERGDFVLGRAVREFEKAFSLSFTSALDSYNAHMPSDALHDNSKEVLDAPYCVGVGNGTDALELAISALDLAPFSEVLIPSNTYIACVEAVLRAGYGVVLVDCANDGSFIPEDYMLSSNTRALLCVHLYGAMQDMQHICAFVKEHNLALIEDCAQAHGLRGMGGRRAGMFGEVACFSFYPGKNLGAFGDGGAVLSRDEALVRRVRELANHGQRYHAHTWEKHNHYRLGRNSRLDSLQAAILLAKLPMLASHNAYRARMAREYIRKLSRFSWLALPSMDAMSVWHVFVIECCNEALGLRDELRAFLLAHGIECAIHYPHALSDMPFLQEHPCVRILPTPYASHRAKHILSLPMGAHITFAHIAYIASVLEQFGERL